jgi:lysophospholipid acyltransferase (LPLAT)-like uncharacterized protein
MINGCLIDFILVRHKSRLSRTIPAMIAIFVYIAVIYYTGKEKATLQTFQMSQFQQHKESIYGMLHSQAEGATKSN